MKRLLLALIPAVAICLVYEPGSRAVSTGAQCKEGLTRSLETISGIGDASKKQMAQELRRHAYTDLKSGEYQDCLDKLAKIDALAK